MPPHTDQPSCCYCDRPLTALERYSGRHCSRPRCRERFLESKLDAFRDEAGTRANEPDVQRFRIVLIPHREGRQTPVEEGQRRALECHLLELARTYAGRGGKRVSEPAHAPEPVPVVCASCQGACCYHGGRHSAFLDDETIERFASQHPDFTPEQIADAYLRHVPATHYDGSCVFHTGEGCHLPREIRASICNVYECRGLRLAREQRVGIDDPLFIVARHDNEIVQGTFVDRSGSRVVGAPAPKGT